MKVGDSDARKLDFVKTAISRYKMSGMYKMALIAEQYDRKENPDIRNFTRMIYTVNGKPVPDTYSTDYRMGRAFFPFFVTQENQYLLSNGVSWTNKETADRLGTKKAPFDSKVQDAGHAALVGAVSYGFWNLDHVDVFKAIEFVPLFDEENGALRGGIRFWQIDTDKPFRATLYEEDGYTEYIWNRREGSTQEDGSVLRPKRTYIISTRGAAVDEEKIYQGENYPSFPIVPFWGNKNHQSELTGIREQIFVYDMIKCGFCNSVEDASYVYWAIHNAPGMDEVDLARFLERARSLKVLQTEDAGSTAEPKQIETPYQARESLLDRLEKDIFKDAMAFDPERIASGAVTATQIRAAYDLLEQKVNDYEYQVIAFINGIMDLAGVDDTPTFTRSKNIDTTVEIQNVMMAATALDGEYVTRKILTLLGDGDMVDEVMARKIDDEVTQQREMIDETGGDLE